MSDLFKKMRNSFLPKLLPSCCQQNTVPEPLPFEQPSARISTAVTLNPLSLSSIDHETSTKYLDDTLQISALLHSPKKNPPASFEFPEAPVNF